MEKYNVHYVQAKYQHFGVGLLGPGDELHSSKVPSQPNRTQKEKDDGLRYKVENHIISIIS